MKDTGIVRKLDILGRIVLPKEMRTKLHLESGNFVDIAVREDRVYIKKHNDGCFFCEKKENLMEYMGKSVCMDCIREMTEKK